MTDPDRILSEFIDAWTAGQQPEPMDYIERAPADARDALADEIATYLAHAPTPDYSADVLAELMADPAVVELSNAIESDHGLWPTLLPRLRRRASLDRAELAARLAAGLGIEGREADTEKYLAEMEQGTLDPRGVSQRALNALGRILGVGGQALARAGDFQLFNEPALSGVTLHGEPRDEVDILFRGGREQSGEDGHEPV
ncbi:MAG: hypothetical protein E6G10_14105 [Actinobacteria bacterium]|nr:MAG: hypothetical protein E6G10_14105 [Actinomycetota bacterium]